MAQDWDIKPRGVACARCEEPFQDKQTYHALLVRDEDGYRRKDYCEACRGEAGAAEGVYSTWQGVFRLPPPPPEEPLKKETAESVLRRLMEEDEPGRLNVVYILAVMLERKRLLVERAIERLEDGGTVRVYEHRKTGETFVVRDPELRLDELEHVQAEVIAMLGNQPRADAEQPQPVDPETAG
jgi:hypothetical protein